MKGLKLFIADIVDDDTSEQTFWYVVGRTYDSAFKKFITEANSIWYRYSYYFEEAEEEDIEEFAEYYDINDVEAGIYEK